MLGSGGLIASSSILFGNHKHIFSVTVTSFCPLPLVILTLCDNAIAAVCPAWTSQKCDGEWQELSQPQSGAPGTRAHSQQPKTHPGAQPCVLTATQAVLVQAGMWMCTCRLPVSCSHHRLLFVTLVGLGCSWVMQRMGAS